MFHLSKKKKNACSRTFRLVLPFSEQSNPKMNLGRTQKHVFGQIHEITSFANAATMTDWGQWGSLKILIISRDFSLQVVNQYKQDPKVLVTFVVKNYNQIECHE